MEVEARVAEAPELGQDDARQERARWDTGRRADRAGQAGHLAGRQDAHLARVKRRRECNGRRAAWRVCVGLCRRGYS